MAMRVTQRSGRCGSAKHNDRSFLQGRDAKETAPHIDQERTKDNKVFGASKGHTLEEQELAYYRKTYGQALEAKNARYREQRHPEKCRTIEDVYRNEKTRPRETILQIGDMHEKVSVQKLEECFRDYGRKLSEWNKAHGNHFKILNFAIHADEATPHIHLRSVWEYTNKDGFVDLGQNKALKLAGVELPDQEKKEGRYNNRIMTFEAETREMWQEVCKAHGLEIETEPRPRRNHLDKADYIAEQKQKELEGLDKELSASKKTIKHAKALEGKIEALEGQERVLNAAQVDEKAKNVKAAAFNPDKVVIDRSDYEAMVRTAHAFEEANKQAQKVQKHRKQIVQKAQEEAGSILKEASKYKEEAKLNNDISARAQLKEIKEDFPQIFNSLGVYQRGHSIAEKAPSLAKNLDVGISR